MLLTEIAEAITTLLNSSPGEWTGESGVVAKTTLDWATCLESTTLQVLIVPEMVQYTLEQAQGRRTILNYPTVKFISVMVGRGFKELPIDDDVAPWSECKELVNIRERVEQFIIAHPINGLKLEDIESIPIDELELDHRNFVAVTQFGYGGTQCGSGPDLLSS